MRQNSEAKIKEHMDICLDAMKCGKRIEAHWKTHENGYTESIITRGLVVSYNESASQIVVIPDGQSSQGKYCTIPLEYTEEIRVLSQNGSKA